MAGTGDPANWLWSHPGSQGLSTVHVRTDTVLYWFTYAHTHKDHRRRHPPTIRKRRTRKLYYIRRIRLIVYRASPFVGSSSAWIWRNYNSPVAPIPFPTYPVRGRTLVFTINTASYKTYQRHWGTQLHKIDNKVDFL